jgi:glycosyltransferase involved in cell wall biosynthesis
MNKQKLIRITTVPISLDKLLGGQLGFMNSFYKVIAVSSENEYLEAIGEKEGVDTFHLEMTRKITPVQDLLAVWKLYRFLKKEKPFIVHTHTPKAGIVGMLAAKLAGIPNRLHTVAGLPLLESVGLKRKVLDFVERLTYACATKVYPNSKGLLEIIKENRYCDSNKLKVLANGSSNGINTEKFSPNAIAESDKIELRKKLHISENEFVFIFVGRIVADKGINELISAFDDFSKSNPQTKLILVGPFEEELDPLSETTLNIIKCNKAIVSVGYQQEVRDYFSIANALVFPSYREGFPNVVMQAAAMGLPCIVSNINGCNEIVQEGFNGLIIPVKNKNAILEAMQCLYADTNLYVTLKNNARQSIVTRYEQKVVWEALLCEYRTL